MHSITFSIIFQSPHNHTLVFIYIFLGIFNVFVICFWLISCFKLQIIKAKNAYLISALTRDRNCDGQSRHSTGGMMGEEGNTIWVTRNSTF